jgi:apolipoprotein D and lipocalin family protein
MTLFSSCASVPQSGKPIHNFEVDRYLGTWYEIARFDLSFERNLDNTAAQYSFDKKGNIMVVNSGHNVKTGQWKSAKGTAKFRGDKNRAALKVSFFGPFYADYNVIALDEKYQYALVAGSSTDYLWILAREKTIPSEVKQDFLTKATEAGFNTSQLIWVTQDKDNPFVSKN